MTITNKHLGTNVHEVADGIFRINTPVLLGPGSFSFNQYLIVDDEPLLFHTGLRKLFPLVRDAVASGSHKYGIILDYVAVTAKKKGSPVDYVYPKEGVVAIHQPIAILKDSNNTAGAKKFIAFMTSKEGQRLVVKLGYRPLYGDVAPPKGFPKTSAVKIVPIDAIGGYGKANALRKQFHATFAR